MNRMNREKWLKVLKGMLIAATGPALIYGLEALDAVDFGRSDVAIAGLVSVLVNLIRQVLRPAPTPPSRTPERLA